ncbi:hypothetical protein JHK87_043264 [Glycine soja]|nr:hypothetical protein JHK87_043264 [Glycine soja]
MGSQCAASFVQGNEVLHKLFTELAYWYNLLIGSVSKDGAIRKEIQYVKSLENKEEDKDSIVIFLLDMLEIVSKDIMDEDIEG